MSSLYDSGTATTMTDRETDFLSHYNEKNWVFSYGSNSIVQLRARVKNPELNCFPACVEGWDRIFCLNTMTWSNTNKPCGVASMVKNNTTPTACTLGSAAPLSNEELLLLDAFEGLYNKIKHDILIKYKGESHTVSGVFYIANDNTYKSQPSEQYLTAIHLMLREQWPEEDDAIVVRGILQDTTYPNPNLNPNPVVLYEWNHPGSHSLSLSALCVEVNAKRAIPWVMPRNIKQIVEKLKKINIFSSAQLTPYLVSTEGMEKFNQKLIKIDERAVKLSTLLLFKEVIGV